MSSHKKSSTIIVLIGAAMALLTGAAFCAGEEVSFNRDVRPILSNKCFACHGFDKHDRKGDLRLDQPDGKDGAYRTIKGITAIKPGSLKDSELWYRITTTDEDEVMPPPKSHKKTLSNC